MTNEKVYKLIDTKFTKSYSLDQLLPNANNSMFGLTRVAMLRALEIHTGSPPLVTFSPSEKATTIALREIALGKIGYKVNSSSKNSSTEDAEDIEDVEHVKYIEDIKDIILSDEVIV